MRNAFMLITVLFLLVLAPAAVAQQEEPYSDGEVPDTTIASGIDAVVQGLDVTFSIANEGSCTWDFGDGESADGNPVSHTYAEAGTYQVTATCGSNVYNSTVAAGPLASTGAEVSAFLLWGGGMLMAGTAAVWFGRREDEA